MNYINKILYILLFLLIYMGCDKNNNIIELKNKIDSLNDSTFITSVGGIESAGKYLYIAATKNNCIYCLNDKFKIVDTIGRTGHGPGEFIDVGSLTIQDNLLFAKSVDQLNVFTLKGKFIKSIRLKKAGSWRRKFSVDENMNIYYSDPGSSGHLISKADSSGNIIDSFGKLIIDKPEFISARNIGHVLKFNKKLIYISSTEPIIQKYSRSGELLEELDLSFDKYIKRRMVWSKEFYKKNPDGHGSAFLFLAAEINRDNLYIMTVSYIKKKMINLLYVVNLVEFKLLKIVQLNPDSNYGTIDIHENTMICFDRITQSFHIYVLDNLALFTISGFPKLFIERRSYGNTQKDTSHTGSEKRDIRWLLQREQTCL